MRVHVVLTEGDVSIAHPRSDLQRLVGSEAGYLIAGKEIPHDGRLLGIVCDHQSSCTSLADVVDRN